MAHMEMSIVVPGPGDRRRLQGPRRRCHECGDLENLLFLEWEAGSGNMGIWLLYDVEASQEAGTSRWICDLCHYLFNTDVWDEYLVQAYGHEEGWVLPPLVERTGFRCGGTHSLSVSGGCGCFQGTSPSINLIWIKSQEIDNRSRVLPAS